MVTRRNGDWSAERTCSKSEKISRKRRDHEPFTRGEKIHTDERDQEKKTAAGSARPMFKTEQKREGKTSVNPKMVLRKSRGNQKKELYSRAPKILPGRKGGHLTGNKAPHRRYGLWRKIAPGLNEITFEKKKCDGRVKTSGGVPCRGKNFGERNGGGGCGGVRGEYLKRRKSTVPPPDPESLKKREPQGGAGKKKNNGSMDQAKDREGVKAKVL